MRSILFVLSLVGCSDYEINPISTEEPTAPASASDVPANEPETNEEDLDTGDTESTDTATTEEPSNCFGYDIEVVGSDYLEPGLWCLPARPYFNLIGEEVVESHQDVQQGSHAIAGSALSPYTAGHEHHQGGLRPHLSSGHVRLV